MIIIYKTNIILDYLICYYLENVFVKGKIITVGNTANRETIIGPEKSFVVV